MCSEDPPIPIVWCGIREAWTACLGQVLVTLWTSSHGHFCLRTMALQMSWEIHSLRNVSYEWCSSLIKPLLLNSNTPPVNCQLGTWTNIPFLSVHSRAWQLNLEREFHQNGALKPRPYIVGLWVGKINRCSIASKVSIMENCRSWEIGWNKLGKGRQARGQ